jgi:Rrf2 family nitric oxide-sensitive transcriptional repressor
MIFVPKRDDMRLAEYTDYTLRVLMYCAAHPHRLVTIGELADHHGASKNHLMKIVNDLARQGVLQTTRGRGGGFRLLKDAASIRIGDVVRASETDLRLVECFDPQVNNCRLTPTCRLRRVFESALAAYLRELDAVTLADIAKPDEPSSAPQTFPLHLKFEPMAGRSAPALPHVKTKPGTRA